MTVTLTPDNFKIPLVEEAYRLRRHAIAQGSTHALDEKTSFWVVRMEAWREFMKSSDFVKMARFSVDGRMRNELFGLPVRITTHDENDVPMIQLVMEPKMAPIKSRW